MQLIEDLRGAADQLEKESALILECKSIVTEFHKYHNYGKGNGELDAAWLRAEELFKKLGEL